MLPASADPFRVEQRDAIALLTLDRPPVNALGCADYRRAAATLAEIDADPAIKAIVIIGAGERAFCAGTDTKELGDAGAVGELTAASLAFFTTLAGLLTPLVGALNGPAVGGGAVIAAECDVLVAVRSAFLAIPELQLGFPGGASHVARLVPRPVALRMLLLGERLTAERMMHLGVLAEVATDADGLTAAALRHAATIAALDPRAVAGARHAVRAEADGRALAGYREEVILLRDMLERRQRRMRRTGVTEPPR